MFFTEEHYSIQALAKEFAEKTLAPVAHSIDETGQFPKEIFQAMADIGFYGIKVPEEYGGVGMDNRAYVLVMEEIARKSGVASVYISGPNSLIGATLMNVATPEQKETYLTRLAAGEIYIAFGLTEPNAGSDVSGMTTRAVSDGDNFIIDGRKCFITGAPIADYTIVFAKTDPALGKRGISAFIVDMKTPGITIGKPEDKMGIRGCPTSDIVFDGVRVHKSCLLGNLNEGFLNAMKTLDVGRIGIAAQSVGYSQGAMDEAVKYIKSRKQFGKSLSDFQGIRFMLSEMETELNAARLLTYHAAYLLDNKQDASKAASMAKYYASEAANRIAAKAMQMHGGYGYIKDYPIERIYRDARVNTLYEGTSEIQKIVIASSLLR